MIRFTKHERFEVWVYDSLARSKRYSGTYKTLEEARAVEEDVKNGKPVPLSKRLNTIQEEIVGFVGRPVVYFIAAPEIGLVKIGFTTNLANRFADLACAAPVALRLIHVEDGEVERERELHRMFRVHQVRGEWFRISGRVADYLDANAKLNDPLLRLLEEREVDIEDAA